MRNWMLMKLRHWLRELPDDLVHLNAGIDDIQLYVDKIRGDLQGGRSADFQIRHMHEVASRLRRADIDGKLVFDIPKQESTKSDPQICNRPKAASNHFNNMHNGARYCDLCYEYHEKANPKTDYRVRCRGTALTIGGIDVIEEWQNKSSDDSPFKLSQAIKLLQSDKGSAHISEQARKIMVRAAALIILEIDARDDARGRNGDAINSGD